MNVFTAFEQEIACYLAFIFVERIPTDHTPDREFLVEEIMVFKIHTPETHFAGIVIHLPKWNRHLVV